MGVHMIDLVYNIAKERMREVNSQEGA